MNMLIPPTISPALYEHQGVIELPENDTLAWLDELENEKDKIDSRKVCNC